MQCEGTVAAHDVVRFEGRELVIVDDDTGQPTDQVVAVPVYEQVAASRCEAEATLMSRGMKEVAAKGGTSWLIVDDRAYCHQHYQPGVMQHLDGALSEHPAMAVDG